MDVRYQVLINEYAKRQALHIINGYNKYNCEHMRLIEEIYHEKYGKIIYRIPDCIVAIEEYIKSYNAVKKLKLDNLCLN